MQKFILAAALAALSAAPAFAMEGTFQPTVTASGFAAVHGTPAPIAIIPYNNADNYGDDLRAPAPRPTPAPGGRISTGSYVYGMTSGNG